MSSTAFKPRSAEVTARSDSGRLFFLDFGGGRVLTANPDGSDLKTIVTEGRRLPDGIVVDVEAGHLYWTNMGNFKANDGSIERSDLDGTNVTTIVSDGEHLPRSNCSSTRQTASSTGRIAKACGSCGAIWMARISKPSWTPARATHVLAPDATKWCVGIAVDAAGGKFYWTQKGNDNAGQGRIFRANMEIPQGQTPGNRADVELLYDNLPEPIDLDLDLANRMMYWTDRGDPPRGNTVNRAPMDGNSGNKQAPGNCLQPLDGRDRLVSGLERASGCF